MFSKYWRACEKKKKKKNESIKGCMRIEKDEKRISQK